MANNRQLPPKIDRLIEYSTVAAATRTFTIDNVLGYDSLILRLYADSEAGTSTIDLKIQGYCETANKYYDIPGASLTQITANMTDPIDLVLSPKVTAVANRVVSRPLPRHIKIVLTVGGTSFKLALESELV